MNKPETMSAAVMAVIDGYPVGHQFFGNQLKDDVVRIHPESKDQYPDTILRMARRHRREAFRVVDRNNSLYEKIGYKTIIERIRKATPIPEPPAQRERTGTEIQLPLFGNQVFFAGFLGLVFGAALLFGAGLEAPSEVLGRPRVPPSFIASKSASRYKPAEPIYRYGFIPTLSRRLLTAADETPNFWDISRIVIPSIYSSLYQKLSLNQVQNVKLFGHISILLYGRIAKKQKNYEFLRIFGQTLDSTPGWLYT
jgi:hypothetical protein